MKSISKVESYNQPQPYFTLFDVDQKKVGFTDILVRWSTLYKLGISLGYTYVHQPIICKNTTDVYNFLGFNESFRLRLSDFLHLNNPQRQKAYKFRDFDYFSVVDSVFSPRTTMSRLKNKLVDLMFFRQYKIIDIVINEAFLAKYRVTQASELQQAIRQLVSQQVQNSRKKVLVRLQLRGARQQFYRLINSQIASFPDRLDLRQSYLETKKKQHRQSSFTPDKLKLLVHIRQGDTAFIETPWKTFIPVYGNKSFTELNDPSEGGYADLIDVAEYYDFVDRFTNHLHKEQFSTVVSSDGYQKAFNLLNDNLDKFNFNAEQVAQLHHLEPLYQKKFDIFEQFSDISCFIGETDDNLYNLIDAALEADIIIMGFRNTLGMLLKIIANYYDVKNPPIIIELYKTRKPFDSKSLLGIDAQKAHILKVKLDDCDWKTLINRVTTLMQSRS